MTTPSRRAGKSDAMPAVTLRFPGRLPNTALSTNARRTGRVWEQKKATDAERATAFTDIRRELNGKVFPPQPWHLSWTAHYPTLRAPDADSLASMLKVWQDVLVGEWCFNDGPQNIPSVTYNVELRSPDAPLMTLEIRRAK